MKVGNLTEQIGTPYPRPVLLCTVCGATYSASAGDYWDVSAEHVLTCCGEPLVLAVERVEFEILRG